MSISPGSHQKPRGHEKSQKSQTTYCTSQQGQQPGRWAWEASRTRGRSGRREQARVTVQRTNQTHGTQCERYSVQAQRCARACARESVPAKHRTMGFGRTHTRHRFIPGYPASVMAPTSLFSVPRYPSTPAWISLLGMRWPPHAGPGRTGKTISSCGHHHQRHRSSRRAGPVVDMRAGPAW